MNRNQRKAVAAESLEIIERGYYTNAAGKRVELSSAIADAVEGTRLFTPAMLERCVAARLADAGSANTTITVENETTLSAARRLAYDRGLKPVLCLNFASAKNPGGGFLGGSQAQEESLARSSALYHTLQGAPGYYESNRACGTALYTDHMILSPCVPVFRGDNSDLLDEPYSVSFLTAPAVNTGALLRNNPDQAPLVTSTMTRRMEMVFALASEQNYRHLILGAWGCGVFGNQPEQIAELFARFLLDDARFAQQFETVVFAVLDCSRDEQIIRPFRAWFDRAARPFPTSHSGGQS
ncbi:MAG: TIGR02452 family protein [Planctomycetes bacterium]|nr:TIGR02452 family protein [Planctomycetota bacterium]